MVKVRNDLTGKVFGRLTVIEQAEDYIAPSGTHYSQWLCECSCENHTRKIIKGSCLTRKTNPTLSCGCYGKEMAIASHKKMNIFSDLLSDEHGDYYIGRTLNTNKEFYIDAEDYEKIKKHCWTECNRKERNFSFIRARINGENVSMHQYLGFNNFDHIDRNELNNRRYNLRPCTISQNNTNKTIQRNNTSGVIGVCWDKRRGKWMAYIHVEKGKSKFLGYFYDKEQAIIARLNAEAKYYGEFAPQKHLFEKYGIENKKE